MNAAEVIAWLFIVIGIGLAYFAPTITGLWRSMPNIGVIVAVNVLLGWTGVGWVVALCFAVRSKPRPLPYGPPPALPPRPPYPPYPPNPPSWPRR